MSNLQQDLQDILDAVKNMKSITEREISDIKDDIIALEQKSGTPEPINLKSAKPEIKSFYLKEFNDSVHTDYKKFLEEKFAIEETKDLLGETKGLPLDGNTSLFEGELNVSILEQAIANNAVLDAIGRRGTENLSYRRTVLTARPEVLLTKENTNFTSVAETTASNYDAISGLFTKLYAFPRVTHEVLEQSDVGVEGNIMKLIAEQYSLSMQDQVLHGDGNIDGNGNQHLKGICNASIDRANNYVEALKPAADRQRDILAAVASGDADGIGDNAAAIEATLYQLMLTVPERSQATSQFIMHPNTLSFLMQNLKDTQGRSLIKMDNMLLENDVWTRRISLYGANIILNETMDEIGAGNAPIIFGDMKEAYELLAPTKGTHVLRDIYTIPDTVGFYSDRYIGSIVADHEAAAVLVCVA